MALERLDDAFMFMTEDVLLLKRAILRKHTEDHQKGFAFDVNEWRLQDLQQVREGVGFCLALSEKDRVDLLRAHAHLCVLCFAWHPIEHENQRYNALDFGYRKELPEKSMTLRQRIFRLWPFWKKSVWEWEAILEKGSETLEKVILPNLRGSRLFEDMATAAQCMRLLNEALGNV